MTANEAATTAVTALVSRLRYKPGATFEVIPDASSVHDPAVYIDMSFESIDSVTLEPSRGGCGVNIPEAVAHDEAAVLALIRKCLIRHETHELDEFLTLDGVRVNDPHAARVSVGEPAGEETK